MEVKPITRHQRRARRLKKLTLAREAYEAALRARLAHRVAGESGALRVFSHSLSWHRAKSPNITIPPAGQEWGRSGPVRVVQDPEAGSSTK